MLKFKKSVQTINLYRMVKMESAVDRHVFYISDGTAITAEVLGHAVMSQFPVAISSFTLPFVENISRARAVKEQIDAIYQQTGIRPLVFYSIVIPEIRDIILQSEGFCQDIVQALVAPLQHEMKLDPTPIAHRTHGLNPGNLNKYDARIAAIDYTLAHDDGVSHADLAEADVILVGVSRSGKTPTSLYLAMQFGIKAANYPLIPEDFERNRLPVELTRYRGKLFGLTIGPDRLSQIRQERRPNSRYASLENCLHEIESAQRMMKREGIKWLDSTAKSIEEISTIILQEVRLDPQSY